MNDRTKDYVFFGYSHKDDISGILEEFRRRGYNVVYDVAMSCGEERDLNARRYVGSDKCKGVVFLVSENFLVSKSVLTETEYAARSGKKSFCVPMQGMTVPELRHSLVLGGLLKQDLGNGEPKQKREWFAKAPAEFKEAFVDRSFRYANTSYIAIAGVK